MGQHYIDPVQYFLNKDNTSPVRVDVDAPQQHPDAAGVWRRIEFTYEDGCQIILDGENKDKAVAYIEVPTGKLSHGFRSDIDRKSDVTGKSVSVRVNRGGTRIHKKNIQT